MAAIFIIAVVFHFYHGLFKDLFLVGAENLGESRFSESVMINKQILLTLDQKPTVSIDLTNAIGVHFDKNEECTNLILKDNKLVSFKGFWEKDLINLCNSFEYCLEKFKSKDRFRYTTNEDVEIKELIKTIDEESKIYHLIKSLEKAEIGYSFRKLKDAIVEEEGKDQKPHIKQNITSEKNSQSNSQA